MDFTEVIFWTSSALLVVILLYVRFIADMPDVDEYFLYHQASVGKIRRPGETAIHRSLVAGHGRSLITGLSISDAPGKTRDGSLVDIWNLAEKTTISVALSKGTAVTESHTLQQLPRKEFVQLAYGLGVRLADLTANSTSKSVGVLLPPGLEALAVQFACSIFGLTAVYIPVHELSEETLQSAVALTSVSVLIGLGDILERLNYKTLKTVVSLITVHSLYEPTSSNIDVETWSSIANKAAISEVDKEDIPLPNESDDYFPAKFVFTDKSSGELKISSFTNQSFVSAIASQIKVLPQSKVWTQKDSVLVFTAQLTSTSLVLQFAVIVVGASLIFPESIYAIDSPTSLISDIKPTIMLTDDHTASSLASSTESLTIIGNILLRFGMTHLSHGNIPSAVDSSFKSLRLIYSDGSVNSRELTTAESNSIRALTGARLIHSLSSPYECGPICQTGFYDYRADDDEKYQNFGPVLPSCEALLKDHNLLKAENREGLLWVRGPAVTSGVQWLDTGLVGKFGIDGCFKVLSETTK